ncbi:sensor histidine kinase [Hyalangium sp.]|uniref:sensor histidine kinase n=1 Tax=Hyalangium sp. TaxID=2028555 RepID=UPI002D2381BB|nr:ATP-binding protein [Hyalangium sp.]HYI02789.1 ATP-binding protein [Hyalangium sp.]
MSIRSKVLLFAGIALGLVAVAGAVLYRNASQAQELRLRLAVVDQQLGVYAGMPPQAWRYLGHLLQAGRLGRDSRELLHEYEQLLSENLLNLEEGLRTEQQWKDVPADPRQQQLIDAVVEAQRQWARGVEVVLRPSPTSTSAESSSWWELFSTYEQEVRPRLEKAVAAERVAQKALQARLELNLQRSQQLAGTLPLALGVLLGPLAALLLTPLFRELRELRASAERIRQGDFSAELPARREDELGSLAHALNRMAQELRDSLSEKERMLQAQAEATERERRRDAETAARDLHRYNAALEQMVRARTVELENANTQLASSLRQLQAMQTQLVLNDRMASMGKVAAGVGHEINNPLAYVISNLSFLSKELHRTGAAPSEEDRQELLTAVSDAKEGAERVRDIVQDLKTLSRPDDASNGRAELKTVVRAAVKIASHEIRRRARLVEELGELPPVAGSSSRLGQVFLNLLINAAHAIPEGHVEENEIRIAARQETPELILVEIHDTGCGIPPENLDRVFDPFFTTKPSGEGTGLGLSLVHSILTTLGGSISVESQVDRGTTFRIRLPTAKALS